MAKRLYAADIEGDGLLDTVTKVWCASFTELSSNNVELRSFTLTDPDEIAAMFTDPDNMLIMHNGYSYDAAAITKVLKVKVKAEIFDTLFYSWYLYPKALRHGLQAHGEDLGIAKPEINDWENLELKDYIHRCEEDVRIQTALWLQMWKHFKLLYGGPKSIMHAMRHLNFKARCVAMQEKARWKLNVDSTYQAQEMFAAKYEEAGLALVAKMPDVPEYATRKPPAKPYKTNGELSATGLKWKALVLEHISPTAYNGDPLTYRENIKVVKGYNPPNAGSHAQVKRWLNSMGWIPSSFKFKRDKETNEVRQIPQIKDPDTEELCESITMMVPKHPQLKYLEEFSVVKHRLDVVNGLIRDMDEEGYVQATVKGLTNTLRFRHKVCVNIPSTRKPYGELIRSLFIAREGYELCGSDMSSLEDRTKQHYMWKHDPEYVKEMQVPGFDPHLDMAIAAGLMAAEDAIWYKGATEEQKHTSRYIALGKVRHGGKSTNYSATYGAKGPTIARAAGVPEAQGDMLYDGYWKRNWSLLAIADECTVVNSRGMKWLWNPVAKMWYYLKAEKDRFSTLNQGTGTYAFDRWLYHTLERRPQLTAQFHDEGIWELKKGFREQMTKILKDAIADVNEELKLNRDLDCDVAFGDNYAEVH
jgi:hypothetical protein